MVRLYEFDLPPLAGLVLAHQGFSSQPVASKTDRSRRSSRVPHSTCHSSCTSRATRIYVGARILRAKSGQQSEPSARAFQARTGRKLDAERAYPDDVRLGADRGRMDGGAHPAGVRRRRTRTRRSVGHPRGDQSQRRQLRRVPRPALQHGHAAAARIGGTEARLPAAHRARRAASSIDGRHRTDDGHRYHQDRDVRRQARRPLRRRTARRSGSRVRTIRICSILLARTSPYAASARKTDGMSLFLVDIKAVARQRAHASPDPQHGESRDERGVLRRSRDPRREPHRRGREGLSLHPRRTQRRAHTHRRRVHRRRATGSSTRRPPTPTSASSSTGRSAATRACSFRSPSATSRPKPPT